MKNYREGVIQSAVVVFKSRLQRRVRSLLALAVDQMLAEENLALLSPEERAKLDGVADRLLEGAAAGTVG